MKAWVFYVACLVGIQAMASQPAVGAVEGPAYQLVEDGERSGGDNQSRPRYDRIIFLNQTPGDYTPVSNRPAQATAQAALAPPPVQAGWVKCPCNGECDCPSDEVCKAGACKKNYVVLFTAKWCGACPRMKRVAEQLEAQGYIVFVVDYDKAEEWARTHKITHVPTTLVYEDGKEVKRFVGVTSIEQIKDGLKKKADQPETVEPAIPYKF
jgi:thioredoxin 1